MAMGDLLDLHAFREKRKAKAERKARRQFELDSNAIVNTGCVDYVTCVLTDEGYVYYRDGVQVDD
jgi:hypothetical protein